MPHPGRNRSNPESVPHSPQRAASAASVTTNAGLTWAIFATILLVYLLFPTRNYYWDGVFFARVIEAAPALNTSILHPNHLLYNVVGYFLYKTVRIAGLQWRAIEVLQLANSVVSVGAAYLLYRILRRSLSSNYLIWALTLVFAFSSTWWKFSTDANAYIFSVFFLLLAFSFTLPEFKPPPLFVTLFFCAAALLHQLAVIAYPVFAVALFWQAANEKNRQLIVAQFCLLSFLIVFSIYYYCFYLLTGTLSPARFAQWVSSYSPDASFSFNLLSNLGYTLRGNLRLFFNARLSLLRGLLSPAIIATIVVFAIVVVLWVIALVKGTRVRQFAAKDWLARLKGALKSEYSLWIGLYMLFLFFWLPHNTFYRLFYLPPVILLCGELLSRRKADQAKPTFRLALFVAVMAFSNFLFFIYPNTRIEKYPPLSLALEMNSIWQPGTIVYFHSENSDNNLVAYFNPTVEWRPLGQIDRLSTELKQVYDEGKTAWLDASAIDQIRTTPGGVEWLNEHGRIESWRERKARGYNVKFIQVGS